MFVVYWRLKNGRLTIPVARELAMIWDLSGPTIAMEFGVGAGSRGDFRAAAATGQLAKAPGAGRGARGGAI